MRTLCVCLGREKEYLQLLSWMRYLLKVSLALCLKEILRCFLKQGVFLYACLPLFKTTFWQRSHMSLFIISSGIVMLFSPFSFLQLTKAGWWWFCSFSRWNGSWALDRIRTSHGTAQKVANGSEITVSAQGPVDCSILDRNNSFSVF